MNKPYGLAASLFLSVAALGQQAHLTEEAGWVQEPTTSASIERRISEAAKRYKGYVVPRVALIDIAFPKDQQEYEKLNKHAVLLITVITHDGDELPIRRVYIRKEKSEIPLTRVVSWRTQTKPHSAARKVFGPHREDSYYLLPIASYFEEGALLLDLTRNRSEFLILDFPRELLQDFIISDQDRRPRSDVSIPAAAIQEFVTREFRVKLRHNAQDQ
jgi:hypothetical protein